VDYVEANSNKKIALSLEEISIEDIIKHVFELHDQTLKYKSVKLSYEPINEIPVNFLSDKLRII